MKRRTFKKLLSETKNTNYSLEETWILGCYRSYLKQGLGTNCKLKLKELEQWWKGCLRTYNNKIKQK